MTLLGFALGGLLRQPFHSALNLFGLTVGVATVVALGMLAVSVDHTLLESLDAGGGDFVLIQEGASGVSFSAIPEADWQAIAARDDVDAAYGFVVGLTSVPGKPFQRVVGVSAEQLAELAPPVRSGALFASGATADAVLGDRAAGALGAGPGDFVSLGNRVFRVTGVVDTGNTWLDRSAFVPLDAGRQVAGRADSVSIIHVRVAGGADARTVAAAIEAAFPAIAAVSTVDDYRRLEPAAEIVGASNAAVSTLATLMGGLAVAAIMAKSALDRTREIGILRAVGWSARRVATVVLAQALVLAAVATATGTVAGLAAMRVILLQPSLGNLIESAYAPSVISLAALVAVTVALAGSAYPTWRAIRLVPADALRYE